MSVLGIIPELQVRYVRQGNFEALYAQWRIEHEKANPPPIVGNVRFVHDPVWRSRVFSITCTAEINHWIWKATAVAFTIGQLALTQF